MLPILLAAALAAEIPAPSTDIAPKSGPASIVLAGGCFWGVEGVFEHVKGVKEAISGYAGGEAKTANYEAVETGRTGHAESVKVIYDPAQVSFGKILQIYFSVAHDPTQLNRQGPDSGPQYRSAIFYSDEEQKRVAEAYIAQLASAGVFKKKIVTQVTPLPAFYPAESYHQHFLQNNPGNPYIVYNDLPKLDQLKKQFPEVWKK